MKFPRRARWVCERLAAGKTLDEICAQKDMPNVQTVHRWLSLSAEFRQRFELARRLQADRLADQVVGIADGLTKEAGEADTRRGRLRIDARKWAVAQLSEAFTPATVPADRVRPERRFHLGGPDDQH